MDPPTGAGVNVHYFCLQLLNPFKDDSNQALGMTPGNLLRKPPTSVEKSVDALLLECNDRAFASLAGGGQWLAALVLVMCWHGLMRGLFVSHYADVDAWLDRFSAAVDLARTTGALDEL